MLQPFVVVLLLPMFFLGLKTSSAAAADHAGRRGDPGRLVHRQGRGLLGSGAYDRREQPRRDGDRR
ncbi:hypothetical protein CDO11_07965 [Xanthomonas oryzae pv. oryzae]|nr:hypothetical protein CDO11_07965 [Xanthomonas oryzae pv. oryzae]